MAAQLQRMAVFRRAPQPSDLGQDVREVLRDQSGISVCGVETDAVRRVEGHAVASLRHVLFGLVRDGVATVRLELAGGIAPSAPATDNAFALQADNLSADPEADPEAGAVDGSKWLDAQGHEVRPPGKAMQRPANAK